MKPRAPRKIIKGNPCKRGHKGRRYADNGECVACYKVRQKQERRYRIRYHGLPDELKLMIKTINAWISKRPARDLNYWERESA